MSIIRVTNLATTEVKLYTQPPRRAVICAYAQSRGDFNTWDYDKYESMVEVTRSGFLCGDWATLNEQEWARFGVLPDKDSQQILGG